MCWARASSSAKDTTNFIANRIGVHGMMTIMHTMDDYDMTPAAVDVIFGKPMGRPKSAVFGTADVVGLDTFVHVAQNCYDTLTEDEERDVFQVPDYVQEMVEKGWTGRKAGGRLLQEGRRRDQGPRTSRRWSTSRGTSPFDSTDTRGISTRPTGVHKVVVEGEDRAAEFAREVTLRSLAYSARRLGEIADDIVNVDRGMRWGFNWELGPFQIWDAIGVEWGYEQMDPGPRGPQLGRRDGRGRARRLLQVGGHHRALLRLHLRGVCRCLDAASGRCRSTCSSAPGASSRATTGASSVRRRRRRVGLEFHTKMNTVDLDIIS